MQSTLSFLVLLWTLFFSPIPLQAAPYQTKITNGVPAEPGEFPFIVSLQLRDRGSGEGNKHVCGATVVSETRLITAASCVSSRVVSNFQVVSGAFLMEDAVRGIQQVRRFSRITLHPSYVVGRIHNDIAVIDLSTPLHFNATTQPIQLPRSDATYSGQCRIMGWGATRSNAAAVDKLYKGNVTLHSQDKCVQAYPDQFDAEMEVCANGINDQGGVVDVCTGDVGGPLVCYENGERIFVGVASWGYMCGSTEKPGVYMDLVKYLPWLNSVGGLSGSAGDDEGQVTERITTTTIQVPSTTTTRKPNGDSANNGTVAAVGDQVDNKPVKVDCRTKEGRKWIG